MALQRGHRQAPPSGTHSTEPTSTARHREHWEGGNDTETATQRSWRGLAAEPGGIEHALAQKRRHALQNSDEAQSLPAMFRASRTQNHPAQEEPETCSPAWDETADVTSTLALERPEQTPQRLLLNSSNKAPTSTGDP